MHLYNGDKTPPPIFSVGDALTTSRPSTRKVLQTGGPHRQSNVLLCLCLFPGLGCAHAHPPTPAVIVHSRIRNKKIFSKNHTTHC